MKLNIFASTTKDGIMSKDKKFFEKLTTKERELLYETTLKRFFESKGINYKEVIIMSENNNKITSRVVTKATIKTKEAILLLKETTPNLTVAVETTDYPIIVASAKGENGKNVCAIALGTIENINNGILHEIIESLIKETNAAPFEMTFYIGACPSQANFLLEDSSILTNNLIWKDTTIKKRKKTYLDLRYAIFNTLISEIVDPNYIYFDSTDTKEDSKYFSNFGEKPGKNLICVVYTNEEV